MHIYSSREAPRPPRSARAPLPAVGRARSPLPSAPRGGLPSIAPPRPRSARAPLPAVGRARPPLPCAPPGAPHNMLFPVITWHSGGGCGLRPRQGCGMQARTPPPPLFSPAPPRSARAPLPTVGRARTPLPCAPQGAPKNSTIPFLRGRSRRRARLASSPRLRNASRARPRSLPSPARPAWQGRALPTVGTALPGSRPPPKGAPNKIFTTFYLHISFFLRTFAPKL